MTTAESSQHILFANPYPQTLVHVNNMDELLAAWGETHHIPGKIALIRRIFRMVGEKNDNAIRLRFLFLLINWPRLQLDSSEKDDQQLLGHLAAQILVQEFLLTERTTPRWVWPLLAHPELVPEMFRALLRSDVGRGLSKNPRQGGGEEDEKIIVRFLRECNRIFCGQERESYFSYDTARSMRGLLKDNLELFYRLMIEHNLVAFCQAPENRQELLGWSEEQLLVAKTLERISRYDLDGNQVFETTEEAYLSDPNKFPAPVAHWAAVQHAGMVYLRGVLDRKRERLQSELPV